MSKENNVHPVPQLPRFHESFGRLSDSKQGTRNTPVVTIIEPRKNSKNGPVKVTRNIQATMADPYLLTSVSPTRDHYDVIEHEAAKRAGFIVQQISMEDVLRGVSPIKDVTAFTRHYATDQWMFREYAKKNNITFAIPNYDQANEWYKVVPHDWDAYRWLQREVSYMNVSSLYHDERSVVKDVQKIVSRIFDGRERVFAKAPVKLCMDATTYTREELQEDLVFVIGVHAHSRLTDLIYSDPIKIAKVKTAYKKAEYRCLIVGEECSSVSIYSDKKAKRDYSGPRAFAESFARHFKYRLPLAYDLDIARLEDGSYAAIEVNDIAACGFYVDNDVYKLFHDIYQLTVKRQA